MDGERDRGPRPADAGKPSEEDWVEETAGAGQAGGDEWVEAEPRPASQEKGKKAPAYYIWLFGLGSADRPVGEVLSLVQACEAG